MNPSLSISDFSSGPQPAYLSFQEMGQLVRARRLHADRALQVDGRALGEAVATHRMADAEESINRLVVATRSASKGKTKPLAIDAALRVARDSEDGHELHYLASMFINEPLVLRQLAKNPNLSEKTQRVLLNDPQISNNVHVMRALAGNPALRPDLMRDLLAKSEDDIVRHEVASNAVQKAHFAGDREDPYVKLCDELADTTYDDSLRLVALSGVRDPAVLRKIARTRDVVFGARELEAVADNPYTPVDVLADLAGVSSTRKMMQAMFGVTVAQKASRTLQDLQHPEDRVEAAGPM